MIIDQVYSDVLSKLSSQEKIKGVSKELLSMKKNYERVLFVYDIMFTELNTPSKLLEVKKCEHLSLQHRNQGNKSYQKREFIEAWQYYNLSLLYAPLNSENFYLAVSNRSAVFYELKKYDECLKDVQYVTTFNIPDELKDKLIKRKEMCETESKKRLNSKKVYFDSVDKLTLKHERDPVYTCASTKLEVKYSKDMGRHVIAKEDIKVGEVLADEDCYVNLINVAQILFSCSNCLKRDFNLLPCDSCCFALYCSDECKMQAFNEYHKIECPLMATIRKMDFTKLEIMALRIILKARHDCENWSDLFKIIEDAESNVGTEFHGHVNVNDKWIYDSKYYTSIHTLETNVDKRSMSDIFQKSVTAAFFLKLLSDNTTFLNTSNDEDLDAIRQCVAGTLLLHVMTVPTNMHNLSSNIIDEEGKCVSEISLASGAYAYHSLVNHSCASNVVRLNTRGRSNMKLMAIRPIKKGMQLFDNYGMHYALEDCESRIKSLKSQYKFICKCEACVSNWPMYMNIQFAKKLPLNLKKLKDKILSMHTISLLERGDHKTAIKVFDNLCQLCDNLEPYVPCREMCDCQEALKQCITIFEGVIPFGQSQTVAWNV